MTRAFAIGILLNIIFVVSGVIAGVIAGLGGLDGVTAGWVPFVQVEDVDSATKRATKLGASVIKPRTRGPAGDYAVVRDPGGATFALWQKA